MAFDQFAASKIGYGFNLTIPASNGSQSEFVITVDRREPVLLVLRATVDVRIRQGGPTVDVDNPDKAQAFLLKRGVYWPMAVSGDSDRYLSLIGDTTTAGTLNVMVASTVANIVTIAGL